MAGCRRKPNQYDTTEREHAAEQQIWCGALFQKHRREGDDDDRRDQHQHRRRAGIDALLGVVQHDVVNAEPEEASEN